MSHVPEFTQAQLSKAFSAATLKRALGYLHQVKQMQVVQGSLTALVAGTAARPYEVEIHFDQDILGGLKLSPFCSCPVGWSCKHAAATLLAWMEKDQPATRINPEVLAWVENFRATDDKKTAAKPQKEVLLYCLSAYKDRGWQITFKKAKLDKTGTPQSVQDWNNVERAITNPPTFVLPEDLAILPLLWSQRERSSYAGLFPLTGAKGEAALALMLQSQRLCSDGGHTLHQITITVSRPATLAWETLDNGRVRAIVQATPAAHIIALEQNWFLDPQSHEIGQLELDIPAPRIARLLELPVLSELDIPIVAAALAERLPGLPLPQSSRRLRVIESPPVPVLALDSMLCWHIHGYRKYVTSSFSSLFDFAVFKFRYDELEIEPDDTREFLTTPGGEAVRVKRDAQQEKLRLAELVQAGFTSVPPQTIGQYGKSIRRYGLESEAAWPQFMLQQRHALVGLGWEIRVPADFRHDIRTVEGWSADFSAHDADGDATANGWLALDLGILIEGQRLPLAPLLHDLFQRDKRWLDGNQLKYIKNDEAVMLYTDDGLRICAEAARIKPLARTLIDLFDAPPGDSLRLHRLDANRLEPLMQDKTWQRTGEAAVRQFAVRLPAGKAAEKISAFRPDKAFQRDFTLALRPYQQEGVAWLQYLREHGLGGILADDMGLGKTAQTLAHLVLEKQAGRLDRPALVVLPTSLVFNWKREAERFAPSLRVLSLHGKERAGAFEKIGECDVALTTYPLLWRDHAQLAKVAWHLLILDEAQTVKNAGSRAAKSVRELDARHRLCLTGTPMENHLGELWAQFDFLLPGFLGDSKQFARAFRTPVEKHGNSLRAEILAARTAPFILRRKKEDVAKELPPKTIIVRNVELEGGQRDLYETVRSAMDKKVREAIEKQGFARSQIVILDALLKLRQVCCDPRLLKSSAAQSVKERAKLAYLMDILPELIAEGRRVLLFSQFTSMLALIEAELKAIKLPYSLLTGDTRDRESAIKNFQEGSNPIFLISLKAGGTGLNLTAADTIIHFDPWWNPAVENQATDRAHRIGQTKAVFVYKLIVAGSIEEKILALQEKKASLADSVLGEDSAALSKFGEADIRALLAPLPA